MSMTFSGPAETPTLSCHLVSLHARAKTSLLTLLSHQALETLDNGKPYVISYLVDLDMVLKCLRYGLLFPGLAIERREGVMLGGRHRTRRTQKALGDRNLSTVSTDHQNWSSSRSRLS